jgi:hypothetical protein
MVILFLDLGATKKYLTRFVMTIPIQWSHNREHILILVRIPPLKKNCLSSALLDQHVVALLGRLTLVHLFSGRPNKEIE